MNTVEIYKGKGKLRPWRYRVVAANNEPVASGQGYFSKWNAKRAAKKLYPDAKIVEK